MFILSKTTFTFLDLYRYNNKLSAHPEYSHDTIICLIPESGEYAVSINVHE